MEFTKILDVDVGTDARPIWCCRKDDELSQLPGLPEIAVSWAKAHNFSGDAGQSLIVPNADGSIAGVLFGLGDGSQGDPSGPSELLLGQLARKAPEGHYQLAQAQGGVDHESAALSWALGAYTFDRYKTKDKSNAKSPRLVASDSVDTSRIQAIVEAVWLGRDLINTPASDLGPEELELETRKLAERFGATVSSIVGEDLLEQNFPMIHAVGRASPRAPRLIELNWRPLNTGNDNLPTVTLVGKGICFDTGGLDLKPASAMALMKKDMGGAAAVLTVGSIIMAQGLDVDLKILIAAADNNVSGNAFRPSDVLHSRSGMTVEIGNTDAEGRLVLADALTLADEQKPDTLISMATLTGAARVALGPDLPALFSNDEAFAEGASKVGVEIGDPVWRMPLWPGYDKNLKSSVADMNNISNGPFAGAITAALFLQRFVRNARRYAHVDLYGWRPTTSALGVKGGEPLGARTIFECLRREMLS